MAAGPEGARSIPTIGELIRLFNTVRYLKPVQIYRRLWYRVYRPQPDLGSPPPLRTTVGPVTPYAGLRLARL